MGTRGSKPIMSETAGLLDKQESDATSKALQKDDSESYGPAGAHSWKLMFSEFISTLLFTFVGCGASVSSSILTYNMTTAGRYVAVSLAHGLAATGLLYALGSDQSGHPGHMNPAITFASLFVKKKGNHSSTKPSQAVMFLIGQLSGAAMGALLVVAAIPEAKKSTHNVGLPELGDNVKPAEAFLCEVILTFMLTFVFFVAYPAYITSGSGFHSQRNNAPMAVGFTITVCYFAGFAISGSCMNPARSFGPALVSSTWADQWIFWIGPMLGAGLAALVFQIIRPKEED